jgi:peptide/nickel transport system ATP-binding protein
MKAPEEPQMEQASSERPLLDIRNVTLEFKTRSGTVHALEQVSLAIARGETVGLVGESGSGKSVLSYAVMRILDAAARVTHGQALFGGMDLLAAKESDLAEVRGREIAMIFQNPRTALNPIRRVGDQIADVLKRHGPVRGADARDKAVALLRQVRIPDPERRVDAYPFEMSGGQCQRVMIAIALAAAPKLLIADEPTTGLDVTTQAAIMALLSELARDRHMSTLLITHDLSMAADHCDRIAVMHAGHLVEVAPANELFAYPRHPYTQRLIESMPGQVGSLSALKPISGNLPDLRRSNLPPCRFVERCPAAQAACREQPLPVHTEGGRMVACHFPGALVQLDHAAEVAA